MTNNQDIPIGFAVRDAGGEGGQHKHQTNFKKQETITKWGTERRILLRLRRYQNDSVTRLQRTADSLQLSGVRYQGTATVLGFTLT